MSHINVWRSIASGPHEYATVMEDDIAISFSSRAKILERMNAAIQELTASKREWDILWWVHGPWAEHGNPAVEGLKHWRKIGCSKCPGFVMYTIKRSLARRLLQGVFPLRVAIDVGVYNLVRQGKIKALMMYPKLAFVLPTHPSETTQLQP
jgi:GR25 family glycosyltransferase involved in LPS biosynthesis